MGVSSGWSERPPASRLRRHWIYERFWTQPERAVGGRRSPVSLGGRRQAAGSQQHMARYIIRGGLEGKRRLEVLARVMWPTTSRILEQAGLRHMCLWQAIFAVVNTDMTIHVEESQGGSALGHASLSQSTTELGGPSVCGQASQFAP